MDALLLAGGYGTRLRPLTYTRPKPLLPVAGRPMLEWALDRLPPEVDRVIVAVNWLADELEAYFKKSERDLEFVVVREQEPLGTGGATKNCQGHLLGGEFFVINGDIVSDMDLGAMLRQHRETGALATIALKEVEPAEVVHYGVAKLDDGDARRIRGFVEKPATPKEAPSHLINAGAYILEPDILELIEPDKLVSLEKEIFPLVMERDGFYGWSFDGTWIDVGDPERLRAATQAVDPDAAIGPDSMIDPDARLDDTVAGAGCRIGAGARVSECVLGDRVTIEPAARLERCVVGDDEAVAGVRHDERIWSRAVPEGYPQKQVGNAMAKRS